MRNHEYCVDCGASDLHLGRTCQEADLEKYKKKQADQKARDKRAAEARRTTLKLAKAIKKQFGVPVKIDDYGSIQIHFWDGAKAKLPCKRIEISS